MEYLKILEMCHIIDISIIIVEIMIHFLIVNMKYFAPTKLQWGNVFISVFSRGLYVTITHDALSLTVGLQAHTPPTSNLGSPALALYSNLLIWVPPSDI